MEGEFDFPKLDRETMTPATATEIYAAIQSITDVDLHMTSIDDLKALLLPLFQGYTVSARIFDCGLHVFRIRRFSNDDKPNLISDLGVPPPSIVTRNQRCNRSAQPMFYCSSAHQAPFFEMHARVGDKFVLSEWKTTKRILVNHVGYTSSSFTILQSHRESPNWGTPTETAWKRPINKEIHEFLAKQFTRVVAADDERFYKLTIALTEKLIHGGPFGGLMYPTIPMQGNADNLALTRECAETSLAFVKAEYLLITDIDGMQIAYDVLDSATALNEDQTIKWKGHPDRWTLKRKGDKLRFIVEHGRWIARDSSGRIVEPD